MARSPVEAPQHVLALLNKLHELSIEQEARLKGDKPRFVSTDVSKNGADGGDGVVPPTKYLDKDSSFDDLMRDKLIALDEDKCHFIYQLIRTTGATNVIEAGTSFGISTIYLALAVSENKKSLDSGDGRKSKPGVIATENEPSKAAKARQHWAECGPEVEAEIDLREGNLLETLATNVAQDVDLLLLDIWTPLALPTVKLVQSKLRPGAVILVDHTLTAADGYRELLAYFEAPNSGFRSLTLPYSGGLEMTVYNPRK
ncbi:S-adenosyl-L-methionine-dependent methyltransferase [Lentinula boryana]|uniref:S-adenosyl-L-methionine-dependent methyltransferase n=1 Tax=Lentinula boryana TaxID=40481 RepID=A0ABQ8QMZ6_9AGAR|nr:S-adenosyl-L-methionine-dependent methyltransferase [Lentinula boryana]